MGGLRRSVPIPQFQFANRQAEIAEIRDFLTRSDTRGQLLLVVAPSGYGKSRLLDHVTLHPPRGAAVLFLNSKRREGANAGISADFALEAERMLANRGLRTVLDTVTDSYHASAHFVGGVIPKLARAAPVVGAAAEYAAEGLVEAISRSSAVHADLLRRGYERLNRLECIVVVVVDDVHSLQTAEQYVLSDLIALGREAVGLDVRYVFGTRPPADYGPGSIRDLYERVAADGKLARIDLDALDSEAMREIAVSLSSTPKALEPAIEIAAGNPQRFLKSLIDMNLTGGLIVDEGMLRVPVNAAALSETVGSVLDILEPVARRLMEVVAVARHDVSLQALRDAYSLVGARSSAEIVDSLQKLDETRLIALRYIGNDTQRETGVYIAHDSVRDLVRHELRTRKLLEYLFANELAAEVADRQLAALAALSATPERESARYNLIIGRAICRREAQKSGWEAEATVALASAETSSRLDDVIDLGASLLQAYRDVIARNAEPRKSVARLFVRAAYQLGRYEDCVACIEDEGLDDGESLYLRATSYAILKPNVDTVDVAAKARSKVRAHSRGALWEPLLVMTEAVALQESGAYDDADFLYETYLATAKHDYDTTQFWQFAFAAPLFVEAQKSYGLARESFDWFVSRGNERSAGMAANNQGYAAMRLRDYDLAMRCFDRSVALLNRAAPHEAVFPFTNIGFIRILRGEGEGARSVLTSCLFRRLWPEYEASVLVNLAYATWLAGWDDPERFLRRIKRSPGMQRDTRELAIERYAQCFLKLLPHSGRPTQQDFDECERSMHSLEAFASISPYWSALAREVYARFGLGGPTQAPAYLAGDTTDPGVSLARPTERCFAHV
jgi:tetratricopeptide (TPR) repeat protein